MKLFRYILMCLFVLPFVTSCNNDEAGEPNVKACDFITVANRVATISKDASSGMYILEEYQLPNIPSYDTHIYLVDREEDQAAIAALGNVSDVIFSGTGMISNYYPSGISTSKKCYKILITSVKPK